uniref:Kinetochore protein SPC25 n=1 Tax=Aureoumbra lagunensis TaxID=44058 RepID=A0A7S3K4I9_9STRA|mmetsp:Transcript_6845/g.9581  ORF Transcript_6845/g.9581 Transcript_6845/m.9581 type:complete len:276 (+) Transcript_6845:74-901(+)
MLVHSPHVAIREDFDEDDSKKALDRLQEAVEVARRDAEQFEKEMLEKIDAVSFQGFRELEEVDNSFKDIMQRVKNLHSERSKQREIYKMETSIQQIENEKLNLESSIRYLAHERKLLEENSVKKKNHSLEFYSKLGLDLYPDGTNSLCLSFYLLDPVEPERRFYAYLSVDQYDQYYLNGPTKPALPAILLNDLLISLNQKNHFGTFVAALRRAFKDLVTSSSSTANTSSSALIYENNDLGPPTPSKSQIVLRQPQNVEESPPRLPSPPPPPLDAV